MSIRLIIELQAPAHIGTGAEERGRTDAAFVKDANGTPRIPGSSLKGLLRDRARLLEPVLSVRNHVLAGMTDRVFGRTGADGGTWQFTSARPVGDVCLAISTHASIDPATGRVADELLFDAEVVDEGTFACKIEPADGADIDPLEEAFVIACALSLERLGHRRRRGWGRCRTRCETDGGTQAVDVEDLRQRLLGGVTS